MSWIDPLIVFAYGYGACYLVLVCILTSIIFSKKVVEYFYNRVRKQQEESPEA
jgi:hypothetical protein